MFVIILNDGEKFGVVFWDKRNIKRLEFLYNFIEIRIFI